jgi:hypothetical protein
MEDSKKFNSLIRPMMVSCCIIACWPSRSDLYSSFNFRKFLRRCHLLLIIILISFLILGIIVEIVVFWGKNMNETIECFMISCALSMALLRVIIFTIHQKDILYIIESMKQDWMLSTPKEKLILKEKCILSFKLAKFFVISVYVTACVFIMPIFKVVLYLKPNFTANI